MTRLASFVVLVGLGLATAACATSLGDTNSVTYHNEIQEYRADKTVDRGRGN